ncbi:tetratricopeptide repeat-containing sulfotransferase family protein [Donghicola mangrovi]|uniref:Sulfotransferase family protein n=1 Tax=Donghicola mangrovi TaxID=2729614 RepID=A0A850Q991_9RHOB|nr:sulfotransferase family protein [Donghicola mangrovi]NVO22531.1 hypothetical protein [Donghicola mangrovi]
MAKPSPAQIKAALQQAIKLRQTGQFSQSFQLLQQVTTVAPRLAEAHYHMALAAIDLHLPRTAVKSLATADRLKPKTPEILYTLCEAQMACYRHEDGLKTLRRLRQLMPKRRSIMLKEAMIRMQLGEFDSSNEVISQLIDGNPAYGENYRSYVQPRRIKEDDPIIPKMLAAYERDDLTTESRYHLCYALAKAYGDLRQDDKVFKYLNEANSLQRSADTPNMDGAAEEVDRLIEAQKDAVIPPAVEGEDRPVPIYVCGMPRSGTTLVERILGRHSEVSSAEELAIGSKLARAALGGTTKVPGQLGNVPQGTLDAVARRLRAAMAESADGDTKYVTDKSIMTFLTMPALALALPDARFVVVRRDPRDVALSIYRNHFAEGTHKYSMDLGDIAKQVVLFEKCVEAFREQMGDRMIEVQYEDLVEDPDTQIPRLVKGVNLPWQEACLHPEEGEGAVRTLSLGQVRVPVYKSAKGGWRRFADDMKPFIETYEALSNVPLRD